ncbi:MAG: CoA-binding protein, partial [Coriobacteriia bacterium]|nr:CoA-binding protein [Coriobacteriia bacterium]
MGITTARKLSTPSSTALLAVLALGGGESRVLSGFFEPSCVAVVGVARDEGKVGHFIFDNLIAAGFPGSVYPVNPRADEIHGTKCYPTVSSLPEVPDLVIIVVPAGIVGSVVDDCIEAGVGSAIVISAGFKETGREGGALERELTAKAKAGGVRLLGPNCLGLISTAARLNASFAAGMPPIGAISFMSQSGALGTAVLDWAAGEGIGLAHFVSLGNRADLSETDLLEEWASVDATRVIVAYLESVSDGVAFIRAADKASRSKPILAVKAGGSDAGARAVSSHTGSLAGSEAAYEAAFRQAGIIRATTVQELFDFAVAFSLQPLPVATGVVIVTNAGGPAVMATDACERAGVALASLENSTTKALRELLPPAAALYNPVDILGDAGPARYEAALRLTYRDPNVNCVLCILTPQAMTDSVATAKAFAAVAAEHPDVTSIACFMGRDSVEEAWTVLRDHHIPNYPFPERAVSSIGALYAYRHVLERPQTMDSPIERDASVVADAIAIARARHHSFITEQHAAEVLDAYGIRVPRGEIARDLKAALAAARRIGYPVVAKIASPDILHKSDVGGIRVGIENAEQLSIA